MKLMLATLLMIFSSQSAQAAEYKFDANDQYYVCGLRTNMYDYLMIADTKTMSLVLDSNVAGIGTFKIENFIKADGFVSMRAKYKRNYRAANSISIAKHGSIARAIIRGHDDTYPGEYYTCVSTKRLNKTHNYFFDYKGNEQVRKIVNAALDLSPVFPFTHDDSADRRSKLNGYDL